MSHLPVSKFALIVCLVLPLAIGCAFSRSTEVPRSGWDQILSTEAIDRALAQLEWPSVGGKSVFVRIGAPATNKPPVPEGIDTKYLRLGVEVALAERGGKIVDDYDEADYVMNVLIGGMGLDISGRVVGIQGSSGGIIPFTIPELALYQRTRREGFAKAEIVMIDPKLGSVVHRSGPVQGTTLRVSTTYLFVFVRTNTDTSRLD